MQRRILPRPRRFRVVLVLAALTAIFALSASVRGLFSGGGPGKHTVRSLRGEDVELFGKGIYRFDTIFVGAGNRGTDRIILLLAIPALLVATYGYWRGSLRSTLLLIGTFAFFLYVYSSTPAML